MTDPTVPRQRPGRFGWSTISIVKVALVLGVSIGVAIFWLSSASMMVEWELTLAALAVCLAAFLSIGLYRGVRMEKPIAKPLPFKGPDSSNLGGVNFDGLNLDGGDNALGCLVALVAIIVFVVLAWFTLEIAVLVVPPLLYGAYRSGDRALRIVFSRSRASRGRVWLSLTYGISYTAVCIGTLFAATWAVRLAWLFATRK